MIEAGFSFEQIGGRRGARYARRVFPCPCSIDYAPGTHDDLANVIAGVAYCPVSRFTSSVSELRI
jgi:hypothetical protein